MLSANVDAIRRDSTPSDDGLGELVFELTEAPAGHNSNAFIRNGVTKTIRSHKAIIAVATAGMEQLFATSSALNAHAEADRLWQSMHAARGMQLMKINLYFERPWWHNGAVQPPVEFGPNFSSLPVNAVYPFYTLHDGEGILDAPAALTIYCDFTNTNFWAGLQNLRPAFDSPMQVAENERVPQRMYGASQAVVDEAKRQLALLFGVSTVPDPVLTSYRLWDGTDDFEYAYHQWRVGVDDRSIRAYLSNPIPDVHFANEAISDMHGWVNGSLRSADLALAHFGLNPLPADPCVKADATPPVATSPVTPSDPGLSGVWGT